MRRPPQLEPTHCVCEPGGDAAKEHGRPGAKAPAHLNRKCPHSELARTTKKLNKPRNARMIMMLVNR